MNTITAFKNLNLRDAQEIERLKEENAYRVRECGDLDAKIRAMEYELQKLL